ncbi:MAG: hypothetical protein HC827_21185 [Cyanobacteria bacterium RM1_2_2]|nr:hypothetical protein [Cyanobacteria bacterium RM1_2_2]
MQPNFEAMTKRELITYALAHRNEAEPLRVLYRRRTPDSEAVWFQLPTTPAAEQEQFEQFKQMIQHKESQS